MHPGHYCREVESYLCRQNYGHLIRIVGPAFELVCGWADRQIPLSVVFGAIDRTSERYYAKGSRRRPVRIEFCEADVLELFDEWRRAVGIGTETAPSPLAATHPRRRSSLTTHIDRVVHRLTEWRETDRGALEITELALGFIEELGVLRERAGSARGDARQQVTARLVEIEGQLIEVVRQVVDPVVHEQLRAEATRELEPFRERMPRVALQQAMEAGTNRLLYDHFRLPRIAFE